ncbi:MAG: hypothetical protein HND44_03845 [Chloroflexi bacterium]|nr:hypothetical protein [Ardenticatenaceae bacterium]MBL1127633.1 hypothetical protein [Chloroflexota bacterium]NOG33698.1 hypothetical protein [Chloroflexota bacterium]GIK56018.1 MAG: hypothetical protein BroJett015_16810 [Chloroflexota bacterium]
MADQVEQLTLPRSGYVEVQINLSSAVNITAVSARRKFNAFLATHVGNLLLAGEPALTITDRIVWRVPVDVTDPVNGRLGRVGDVDVAVDSGELLLTSAQINQLEQNAYRLAAAAPLPSDR